MPEYDKSLTRGGVEATISEEVVTDLLARVQEKSFVLRNARIVPMSKGKARMPAVAGLATAYFVNGDSGLKQTTDFSFGNKELIVEEIAALVVIPDNVDADSDEALGEWAKTEVANALYRKVDDAILFGHDRATWPAALVELAEEADHVVTVGTSPASEGGITGDLDEVLGLVETAGGDTSIIAGARRLKGLLRRARNTLGDKFPGTTSEYDGTTVDYSAAGSFPQTPGSPIAVAADWNRVLVGLRADVTFTVHTDGIISNEAGQVVYNAMQQDGKILRATLRIAYQVDDTLSGATRDVDAADREAPVAVLVSAGAAS